MTPSTSRRSDQAANFATRFSVGTKFALIVRLRVARFLLRISNVTGSYRGPHIWLANRLVGAVERVIYRRPA